MRLKSGQLWSSEADARGQVLDKSPHIFWTTLVEQIQQRRCTPIIGPRVYGDLLPAQTDIARQWAAQHHYPFSNLEEMARVAQYLATGSGEGFPRYELLGALKAGLVQRLPEGLRPADEAETLTELVQTVGWQNLVADNPNQAHRVLADLDLPLYLTTNPDSFMVEALRARGKKPVRELCRWDEDLDWPSFQPSEEETYKPTPESPLVYHLFGSDEEVDSLVITEDHYFKFLVRTSAERDRIPNAIRMAPASSTLMFVGYSLYDWELRVLLHGLVASMGQRRKFKHVAVQLEPADIGDADITAVQTFLQQYFQDEAINVFWGSTAQFMAELRERWEGRRR
jgi:hypothetical protein